MSVCWKGVILLPLPLDVRYAVVIQEGEFAWCSGVEWLCISGEDEDEEEESESV